MDVAFLGDAGGDGPARADLGDARDRGLLRLRVRRSACCSMPTSSAAVRDARVAVLFVHAVNPHGFSYGPARQRGQRRPQPQLPRFHASRRPSTRPMPKCIRCCCRRPGRRRRRTKPRIGALDRGARRARLSGGGDRRPVRVSGRPVLRRQPRRRGATGRCARCCAGTRRHRSRLGWIDFHTGLGPRGHGEKIYAGRDAPGRSRAHARVVGRRRHVVSRRLVDVGAPDRRHVQRRPRRMPGRGVRRDRARVRHACRCRKSSWRCAPITGCTIIRTRRTRSERRSAGRCATRSTSTPTTGSNACMRRRAMPR